MTDKVTIKDIAKLVGVSTATISHYINRNYSKMSEKTKQSIKEAIELTGYQPSMAAKGLATSDYKTVGVVIADITNPFISSVMKGINDICRKEGYNVNFTNSDNDLKLEMENINRLKQQNVSGIILDPVDADNPLIKTLPNKKTMMVDRQSSQIKIDTIVSNNEESTFHFIQQMKKKGYGHIYFVSSPLDGISTRQQRYNGFKKAMELRDDQYLIEIHDEVAVEAKLHAILEKEERPIGFFTVNGPTLLTFMRIIQSLGYSYPADFGVGSYEDLDWMRVLKPGISCIRQDSYQIGCLAAETLINKLKGNSAVKNKAPRTYVVPTQFVMRESF